MLPIQRREGHRGVNHLEDSSVVSIVWASTILVDRVSDGDAYVFTGRGPSRPSSRT